MKYQVLTVLVLVSMTVWVRGDEKGASEVEFQAASRCEAVIQLRGKDLNLSDAQKEKIDAILRDITKPERELTKIPELDELRKIEAEVHQRTIDAERQVREVLTPEQLVTYRRIFFTMVGVPAFELPEIIKELEITSEQRDKIKPLMKAHDAEMKAFLEKDRDSLPAVEKAKQFLKFKEELTSKYVGKILGVLTAEQKEKYQEIVGK